MSHAQQPSTSCSSSSPPPLQVVTHMREAALALAAAGPQQRAADGDAPGDADPAIETPLDANAVGLSRAAVVAAAAGAAADIGAVLRERTLPPWTAVLPVSWQLGPPELLSFLLDEETVLSDKVWTRSSHA